jgi:hypothetical protein
MLDPENLEENLPPVWHAWLGLILALVSLLAMIGGFRFGALLLLAFDFGSWPFEIGIIPIAVLSWLLCRSPASMRRAKSYGSVMAMSAIVTGVLIGVLSQCWGMISTGSFP